MCLLTESRCLTEGCIRYANLVLGVCSKPTACIKDITDPKKCQKGRNFCVICTHRGPILPPGYLEQLIQKEEEARRVYEEAKLDFILGDPSIVDPQRDVIKNAIKQIARLGLDGWMPPPPPSPLPVTLAPPPTLAPPTLAPPTLAPPTLASPPPAKTSAPAHPPETGPWRKFLEQALYFSIHFEDGIFIAGGLKKEQLSPLAVKHIRPAFGYASPEVHLAAISRVPKIAVPGLVPFQNLPSEVDLYNEAEQFLALYNAQKTNFLLN